MPAFLTRVLTTCIRLHQPMINQPKASSLDLPPMASLVPNAEPVVLRAYYPEFATYYPEAELQTKRWLVRHAQPNWIALDVGANVGLYSLLLSRLLREGEVHAVEPTATATMLRRNLEAAGAGNVTVHEVALGARSGLREEPIYRIWGEEPETRTYPFATVDELVDRLGLERLDCLKIDVDGFDLEVLQGAEATLRRFDPWVIVELNHALATRGRSAGEALLWLLGQGYREAMVLDQENFVLKRGADVTPATGGLRLDFDREPILLPPAFVAGTPLPDPFAPQPTLHNAARFEGSTLDLPGPRWGYAASWPWDGKSHEGALLIDLDLEVRAGAVGVGCVTPDFAGYVGKEVYVDASPGRQTVLVLVPDATAVGHLILRNTDPDGAPSRAVLHGRRVAEARPAAVETAPLLDPRTRSFALDRILDPAGPDRSGREVRILPVEELATVLGCATPYVPARPLYRYGLESFRTEIDEPGIYRFLYRHVAPRRHLEFGTWEGFGTVLCAESCDAEIWTVNLPEGERDEAGRPLYGSQVLPGDTPACAGTIGDAGERIGWRYRAAGFGHRVHQLLCDSRDFPEADFAPGFFDSVLIDGGHTPDVVASDTDKALRLVRPGGLMIWHDFCPEPKALAASEAGRGVVRAWVDHHDRWRPQLSDLFWLRPSWLLVGIKL